MTRVTTLAVLVACLAVTGVSAQRGRGGPPRPAGKGTTERFTAAGNQFAVYLPPSYATDAARRFPVVYLIADGPAENLKLQEAADRLSAAQGYSEPIIVVVDVKSATGDAEKLIAQDLVAYVDTQYRTLTARISRGLAGCALGGDAALRIASKRADVYSSLYLLSASFVDATVAGVDADVANLQRFYDIAVNVGTRDAALAMNRRLHDTMQRLKIPHYYEEYDGAFADRVGERMETRLVPFFSRNLTAPANPTSPAVQ